MASKPPAGKAFMIPSLQNMQGGNQHGLSLSLHKGPTIGSAQGTFRYQSEIQREFDLAGMKHRLNEFSALINDPANPKMEWVKIAINATGSFETGRTIVRFYLMLARRGFTASQIRDTFIRIGSITSPRRIEAISKAVASGTKFEKYLGAAGSVASMADYVVTFFEIYELVKSDEWSQVFATVYEKLMGKAIFWAGLIQALQSLIEAVAPEQAVKSRVAFKVMKAFDPIGLGKIGIDSMVWAAQASFDAVRGKPFDDKRLSQLVGRMKTGPTAIFAELGENAGDAIFEISEMDSRDWNLVGRYTIDQLREFIKSPSKGGRHIGETHGTNRRMP